MTRDFLEGDGSAVIPRLRSLIDANYPGTGLAITEYNFGGVDSIAGALAQADALGIMGREDLDLATLWEPYADWVGMAEDEFADRPVFWAFRLFRNYDGFGGRFGDTSVFASSSDEPAVSIHAATRSSDGALTLLVLNKSTVAQASPLSVAGYGGTAEAYRYSGADLGAIERIGDVAVGPGTVLDLPARSATLLVLPEGDGGGTTTTTQLTTTTTAPTTSTTGRPTTTRPATTSTAPTTSTTTPTTVSTSTSTTVPEPPRGVELPSVANGAVRIDPPRTMAEGGPLDSNDATWVWLERGPVTLDRPVTMNRIASGDFTGRTNENAIVPAGTTVCSFRMWADRFDDNGRLEGSLRFDRSTVLGVIHRSNDVRASEFLRPDGIRSRVGPLESTDKLSLTRDTNGTTLWWDLRLVNGLDGARILTDCGG